MSTLHVYGDSFVADENNDQTGWPYIFAKSVGLDVINRGVSGSSTEYAFYKFMHDNGNQRFSDGDVIVFLLSTPCRIHFTEVLEKYPQYGSQYINITAKELKHPNNQWLKDNKEYLDWWYVNTDWKLQEFTHEAYIHMLKTWAENNPTNKVIILHNQLPTNYIKIQQPDNFFMPQLSLCEVSDREHNMGYPAFITTTQYDCRINHLTIPNASILANLIVEMQDKKNYDKWTYDSFESDNIGLILNMEHYMQYVDAGVIPKRQWIMDQII